MSLEIKQLKALPDTIEDLAKIAHAEGYFMLDKLISKYRSGENTFTLPGEALFGVSEEGVTVGIGGLNIDPYFNSQSIGRVRHLYVHPKFRCRGVGRLLTHKIEEHALGAFSTLQLFTPSESASTFYQKLGYKIISNSPKVSHAKTTAS